MFFTGVAVELTPEQRIVELVKYLGIGYHELMDSPAWFLKVAEIRARAEYNQSKIESARLDKISKHPHGRR